MQSHHPSLAGQTLVEYALILVLVSITCVGALSGISDGVIAATNNVSNALSSNNTGASQIEGDNFHNPPGTDISLFPAGPNSGSSDPNGLQIDPIPSIDRSTTINSGNSKNKGFNPDPSGTTQTTTTASSNSDTGSNSPSSNSSSGIDSSGSSSNGDGFPYNGGSSDRSGGNYAGNNYFL